MWGARARARACVCVCVCVCGVYILFKEYMLELDIINYNKISNSIIIPFPANQNICEILQRTSSIYPQRLHVCKLIS